MRRSRCLPLFVAGAGVLMFGPSAAADAWIKNFPIEKQDLASTGRNPYFILEPGYYLSLRGGGIELTITVLNETKIVDGVETRVVEERDTKGGKLLEISKSYFAISRRTKDVFYFGEDVYIYKGGKLVSDEGAWLAGVKGAKFGLMIPGQPLLNARYYQEVAPGVALDRVEIVSLTEKVKTKAGEFTNCLKLKETTPLEPGVTDYKYYTPGIGMVQDGSLKLTAFGTGPKPKN
jgi:hypothetical protein